MRSFLAPVLSRAHTAARSPRGFALIVVVTVLAFLVLLVVALASLTRVETQVATNTEQLAQARQHALSALHIALGQLQRYAGPDQRVTARADISSPGAIGDAGTNRNPHWTGVWDSTNTAGGALTWLVSGNDNDPLGIEPDWASQRLADVQVPFSRAANGSFANAGTIKLVGSGSSSKLILGGVEATNEKGHVIVPAIPVETNVTGLGANQSTGRMAYWIGDEGIKADIAATAPASPAALAPLDTPEAIEQRHALIAPGAAGHVVTAVGPAAINTAFDRALGNWASVTDRTQVSLPLDSTGTAPQIPLAPAASSPVRAAFHSITAGTYGLQTDTRNGGLKVDLTNPTALTGQLTTAIATILVPGSAAFSARVNTYATTAAMTNFGGGATDHPHSSITPSVDVAPVLTEFQLIIGVKFPAAGGPSPDPEPLALRAWSFFSLHNPYISDLTATQYRVRIQGLPVLDGGDYSWSADGTPLGSLSFEGDLYPSPATLATTGNVALPAGITAVFGSSITNLVNGDLAPGVPVAATPHYTALHDTVDAGAAIHSFTLTPTVATQNLSVILQLWNGSAWADVPSATTTFALSPTAINETALAPGDEVLIQISARKTDTAGTWASSDPRDPGFPPATWTVATNTFPNFATKFDADGSHVYSGPGTSVATTAGLVAGFTGYLGTVGSPATILFELPTVAPAAHLVKLSSVGQLRHVHFTGAPPWHLGSFPGAPAANASISGLNNALLDSFFFSGYDRGATAPSSAQWIAGAPGANPRIVPIRTIEAHTRFTGDATGAATAGSIYTRGSFNLNSTSTAAWAAVLQAAFGHDPRVLIPSSTGGGTGQLSGVSGWGQSLHSAFPRFGHNGGFGYYDLNDGTGTTRRSPWHNGYREVSPLVGDEAGQPALTEAQSHALALRIANAIRLRLRAKLRPFGSIAEFANSGLLQEAIDNDSDLSTAAPNPFWIWPDAAASSDEDPTLTLPIDWLASYPNIDGLNQAYVDPDGAGPATIGWYAVPAGMPSHLSQADILSALLPWLSVRSDTFLIRAYGETINPATGESTGRAWCEATVQRTPEYVDTSDTPDEKGAALTVDNTTFGRRFKIVSFRWLTENDI